MRTVGRLDATVAVAFALAATGEAVARYHHVPGQLVVGVVGSFSLCSLAVRRCRPMLSIGVIAGAALVISILTAVFWPMTGGEAGVWILAMMLACYSLGAYGRGRDGALGVVLPLAVVLTSDLTTTSGRSLVSGVVFVTVFVGVLPTAAGSLIRIRRVRLLELCDQARRIRSAQRARQEAAVVTERLLAAERLRPVLVDGLRAIVAGTAEWASPADAEAAAQRLLGRTREEVMALTAPVPAVANPLRLVDHLHVLRTAAQPWTIVAAGAVAIGLVVETSTPSAARAGASMVLVAAIVVGAPLGLAWSRPLMSITCTWIAATAYSRMLAPLDGTIADVALVCLTAFTVAALSRSGPAVVGLAVCWLGQVVGVGALDPVGESTMLLLCWLAGLAIQEATRMVEQADANNDFLARQETLSVDRALVDERLRLAREIHDTLGHTLTVVALQAGAARRLTATDPDRAREAMRTAAAAARDGVEALESTGRLDLTLLLTRVRQAGLDVEADLTDESLLDPQERVVAFQVVQEALTNVLRHAPGARATVRFTRRDDGIELGIVNSPPTGTGLGPGTGRGLEGLRERVDGTRGYVRWTPRPDGGFGVYALLPASSALEKSA